jgi:gliding motility-associated-like protein
VIIKVNKPSIAIILHAILLVAASQPAKCQMTTDNTLTPTQLVQNVLLGGGVTVSNVQFSGYQNAIGRFQITGSNNLGISEGIVLTTGSIFQNDPVFGFGMSNSDGPQGPNNSSGGGIDNLEPGDPYLESLLPPGVLTYNRAILEFDFVPTTDSIQFNYVFGTDEYMEFIGGGFADIFAFVLSGVSVPLAPTNIALIPNTNTPVTALTINANTNSQYYVNNENPPGQICQYDGFTKVLTAKAAVICGETYHIRIMIADALDGAVDAGVFLQAGSFSSSGNIEIIAESPLGPNDSTFIEGCGNAKIKLKRTGNLSAPLTVTYSTHGTSTNGTDYTGLTGTATFPALSDSVIIPIQVISDGIAEGIETLIITVQNNTSCGSSTSTVTLYIQDATPIQVVLGNDLVLECSEINTPIQTVATISGGHGAYAITWSNGLTGNPITFTPFAGQLTVSVSDACGNSASDDLTISFINADPIFVEASNDTLICKGEKVQLWSIASGGNGNITYTWSSGQTTPNIDLTPSNTQTYTITVSDQCGMQASKSILVQVSQVDAMFMFTPTGNQLEYQFTNLSSTNALVWTWDFGDQHTSNEYSPIHQYENPGNYQVSLLVTNADGCSDEYLVDIHARIETVIFIPNSFTPNLDGTNDIFYVYGTNIGRFEMWIFDRWGKSLFYSNNKELGWDGSKYPTGTYVYRIEIVDDMGKEYSFKGMINLIR